MKESLIVDASNRFFTVIPSIHPHVIRDEDDFKSKVHKDLCGYIFHVFAHSQAHSFLHAFPLLEDGFSEPICNMHEFK